MSGVVRALEVRFAHFLEPHGYMSVVNEKSLHTTEGSRGPLEACTPPGRSEFVLKFGAKIFEKLGKIRAKHGRSLSKFCLI